jgi:ADP-heptose:LPS heptosyltransferase
MDLLFQRFSKIALFTHDQEGAANKRLASLDGRQWIVASPLPPKGAAVHTAEWMKKALSPLGVQETEPSPTAFLCPSPESNQKARALLHARRLEDTRFLALHPGSGGEAKCASPEALAGTARAYLDNTDARLLLIAGPADAKAAQAFRVAWGAGLAELYSPPLPVLGALLSRASAYLGCDSGVSHLAALYGAPSLVLFGPTSDQDRWVPLGPRADWLWWKEWNKGKGVLEKLAAGERSKNPREKIRAAPHSNNFPSRPQRTDPASAFQDQ